MLYTLLQYAFCLVFQFGTVPAAAPAPIAAPRQQVFAPGDSLRHKQLKARLQEHTDIAHSEKCYLHTDRTLYFPGETLWYNAWLLNGATLQPASKSQVMYVHLYGPNGGLLQQHTLYMADGAAPGNFDFNPAWPGGIYKIKAWTNWMTNTRDTFMRNITLQKTVLPNINLRLEWERKAYGPGEEAIARVDIQGIDNKVFANQQVAFTADAGGQQFATGQTTTDVNGRTYIRVQLPPTLSSTDGLLNVQVVYNGQTEAISRSIPLVLNQVDVQFFPEGGDAVAGLPCRMAFKALNEFGKPADISGEILNAAGNVVTQFSSYHNGLGAFEFVPKAGVQYQARITQPFQSTKKYDLPAIQTSGCALRLQQSSDDQLRFEVSATSIQKMYISATTQDEIVYFSPVQAIPAGASITIPTAQLPPGITRVTLFDAGLNEQAERLVFVNRDKGLQVDIQPDKDKYLPREQVKLKIAVKDHTGKPVKGRFSLAVSDETNLTFADDKQANILASLLLEQDLKGKIEEPNFYFDPKEPKSMQALDYLMLTHGWRRFTWKEVMSNDHPALAIEAEGAGFTGKILKSGEAVPNKKITLFPDGPSSRTGADGSFAFYGVNLEPYTHLRVGGQNYPLSGYKNQFDLTPLRVRRVPNSLGNSFLTGKVTDPAAEEVLIAASIKIFSNNKFICGGITDVNGNYRIGVGPGKYDVEISYTGFGVRRFSDVVVYPNELSVLDVGMEGNTILNSIEHVGYTLSLVKADQTSGGKTLTSEQVKKLPTRSVNAIVATTAKVTDAESDDVTIKGSRSNATNYYIDGVRVFGEVPPVQDIDVYTGGTPANYDSPVEQTKEFAVYNNNESSTMREVVVMHYRKPIIRADDMTTGKTYTADQLQPWVTSSSSYNGGYRVIPYKYNLEINARQFYRAREFYAPVLAPNDPARDTRTTLYWNPIVTTDIEGKASVVFHTADAISNYRVTLEGVGEKGQVGHGERLFYTEKPLSIDVKTPPFVVSGDTLRLQIAVHNKSNYLESGNISVRVPAHFTRLSASEILPVSVAAKSSAVYESAWLIGKMQGTNKDELVEITFLNPNGMREVFRSEIQTIHHGYPVRETTAGRKEPTLFDIQLLNPIKGSVNLAITAYPSTLDEVLTGMDRMLRQPSGCFEQTSSCNYPNLLVLDLLKSAGRIEPTIEAQARNFLDIGYKRLLGFEVKSGGFDWYGNAPGHAGLTAYGILQFCDMKKVYPVDQCLIDRSVAWLKTRRDGSGGWKPNDNAHTWGDPDVQNAYICWALCEAGYGADFLPEINAAYQHAKTSDDLYQIALMANTLQLIKDPRAEEFIEILEAREESNGSWMGKKYSFTFSSGPQLRTETTALAVLALLKAGKSTSKSIEFISSCKNPYGYGNTQTTILVLKALVAYTANSSRLPGDGTMFVQVDGKIVSELPFSAKKMGRIAVPNLSPYFTQNNPQVKVFFEPAASAVPYDVDLSYDSYGPSDAAACPLKFSTNIAKTLVKTGETNRFSATISNTSSDPVASPMMVLGIPAGLSLQPWQLKQIMDQKGCDFYEIWDNMVVFHFRQLLPGEERKIDLDLKADIAGTFEAPASQAFLYYSNDQRVWSKPENVRVQ